jgi:hypothetical protein
VSAVDHGALTDLLLAAIEDYFGVTPLSPLVGDGEAPAGGGWLEGQAGVGVFRPYTVVVSAGAVPLAPDMSSHGVCWKVGFSLRSFGGSRRQCDRQAFMARGGVEAVHQLSFGSDPWRVFGFEWTALGPVSRIDSTSPAFWQAFDSIVVTVGS